MSYNQDMMDSFDEWLRDNYDAFEFKDLEYCADEVLYKFNRKRYFEELDKYIENHNMFAEHGDIRDERGYLLDPQPKEVF